MCLCEQLDGRAHLMLKCAFLIVDRHATTQKEHTQMHSPRVSLRAWPQERVSCALLLLLQFKGRNAPPVREDGVLIKVLGRCIDERRRNDMVWCTALCYMGSSQVKKKLQLTSTHTLSACSEVS